MSGEDPSKGLTSEIAVPSTDPEKPKDQEGKEKIVNGDASGKGKGKEEKDVDEISEEDLQLKSELEMLVERLKETDDSLYLPALESLRTLIRTSTSSMTSVPKPLKFLRPFYEEMGKILAGWNDTLVEQKSLLASILSVLAMTYSDSGKRETLHYRLQANTTEEPGLWGHEYVRHLAAEVGEEWATVYAIQEPSEDDKSRKTMLDLAQELVKFFLKHNAEADAVDLLLEVEAIEFIAHHVDESTYERVCRYIVSCVPLLVPPDDRSFLATAAELYAKFQKYPEALSLAIRMNDRKSIRGYYEKPTNPVMKKQLSYLLARAQVPIAWVHTPEGMEEEGIEGPSELSEDILECLGNIKLSQHFKDFGKAVGAEEAKTPEDIYKMHLDTARPSGLPISSAKHNLASTFVNAFVNAGFGNDKLMVTAPEGASWIYKNKDHGMMSATASVGMSLLWDSEAGIDQIDKFTYSAEEHIKAGAFLGMGILHSGIRMDPDVAFALLEEHVDSKSAALKVAAIQGIAMAYCGSQRKDIMEKLLPHVADETNTMEVASMAALALGFVFVGSGEGEIVETILQTLMEREPGQLDESWAVFMSLALGLVFLGTQDASEAAIETLRAIEHPMAETATVLTEVCSYAGTGNVLKVQEMLHICSEHPGEKKDEVNGDAEAETSTPAPNGEVTADAEGDVSMNSSEPAPLQIGGSAPGEANGPRIHAVSSNTMDQLIANMSNNLGAPRAAPAAAETTVPASGADGADGADAEGGEDDDEKAGKSLNHQAMATIGIALIAMGEEVGSEMALRQFQHLMTYGDGPIRKAVPLALGLISASNPQLPILDTLSKYSHDSDLEVAQNAILSMGLVGAGTNNARLAQMLRGLASYYYKEPDTLFMVRVAQGLVHMGKGTIGINPFFNDRAIMSKNAVAGILAVLVSFTDAKSFVLGKHHWMLYWLVTAMFPQFLITLDEDLKEKAVTVRVGQAVNTVGQAGTRHGISGFQTHQTPVRVGTTERAELGTNEYFPYSSVLEGLVILKKNEGYDAEDQ